MGSKRPQASATVRIGMPGKGLGRRAPSTGVHPRPQPSAPRCYIGVVKSEPRISPWKMRILIFASDPATQEMLRATEPTQAGTSSSKDGCALSRLVRRYPARLRHRKKPSPARAERSSGRAAGAGSEAAGENTA